MNANTEQIVSISEDEQNFSKVAEMADKMGEPADFKNDNPEGGIIGIEPKCSGEMSDDERIDLVVARILEKYRAAFDELAK